MTEAMVLEVASSSKLEACSMPTMMTTPSVSHACAVCENGREGCHFMDLIFVHCQSTTKTVKIGSLENLRLCGNTLVFILGRYMTVSLMVLNVGGVLWSVAIKGVLSSSLYVSISFGIYLDNEVPVMHRTLICSF